MATIDRETSAFLSRVAALGKATHLPVVLSPLELMRLMAVIFKDVGITLPQPFSALHLHAHSTYYNTSLDWFAAGAAQSFDGALSLLMEGRKRIADFDTYLRCLSELHKRRLKYARILSAQPLPTMVQVSPRALVEHGAMEPVALASWLTWRKWFFDLDNRSAQETGYLFEPILAAALGGTPKGARASVVRRRDDPSKGRQVDCFKLSETGKALAYEFKLRVTIAASGQGRFGEELAFADDCAHSGVQPILLVLDPTPNPRLQDLQQAFERHGGLAFVGEAAWQHLYEHSGQTMSTFIDRYVAAPIKTVTQFEGKLLPFSARQTEQGDVGLFFGQHHREISRHADPALDDDQEDPE